MNALLGMMLVLSTGISFLAIFYALWLALFNEVSWAWPVAVWFFLNANSGWRFLKGGIGITGVRHNGEGAAAWATTTMITFGLQMLNSPPIYSAWWGLLVLIVYLVLMLALQILFELLLDIINKSSKR